MKMSAKSKVEIDERLTNLFHSRRNKVENNDVSSSSASEQDEEHSTPVPQELSWLSQFAAALPGSEVQPVEPVSMFEVTSTFVVRRSECRPFWSSGDLKSAASLWKKSKRLLTQDCQKQRKAALRKSIRRYSFSKCMYCKTVFVNMRTSRTS